MDGLPQNLAVLSGTTATLTCEASTDVGVRIMWLEYAFDPATPRLISDGIAVTPGHPEAARYSILQTRPTQFDLVISPTVLADGGRYICMDAQDGLPNVYRGNAELVIIGRPNHSQLFQHISPGFDEVMNSWEHCIFLISFLIQLIFINQFLHHSIVLFLSFPLPKLNPSNLLFIGEPSGLDSMFPSSRSPSLVSFILFPSSCPLLLFSSSLFPYFVPFSCLLLVFISSSFSLLVPLLWSLFIPLLLFLFSCSLPLAPPLVPHFLFSFSIVPIHLFPSSSCSPPFVPSSYSHFACSFLLLFPLGPLYRHREAI